jgi:peptidoglycan/xylan/chitin deacetylase (PgdA/CDA1 family)
MVDLIKQIPSVWVWIGAIVALAAGGWALLYYLTYAIRSQVLGRTIWRGQADTNAIALTFDDGPSEDTDEILDVLKQYQIKAAFFMIGKQVERFPEVARRVVREGHEIGNHSLSHPIFLYQRPAKTRTQLEIAQKVIGQVTGVTPKIARPPCGVRTPSYFRAAQRLELQTVQWSVAGFDWKNITAAKIAKNVLSDLNAGSIVLLHDGDDKLAKRRTETARALPAIIEGIWARNLRIAPLREICGGYQKL